jgi:hypothetical protein
VLGRDFARDAQPAQGIVPLSQIDLRADHPAYAVATLEEVMQDHEIANAEKLDFFYWMVRAQIDLRQWDDALRWLRVTREISPQHRDCADLETFLTRRREPEA